MNNEPNISIYGADGTGEDFPVLKAFQQYIDAEQAKARRRLLTVSIFFGVMLIAVIAVFSALVISANNRTQSLNDRLVEYAMKEAGDKVEAAKATALQEATVKTMTDTLQKLQQQLEAQERKATEAAAKAARELAAAKAAPKAAAVDPEADRRNQEATAKLQKAMTLLKQEKAKLAAEKEKLRQEELERYRREHYPEYYAKKNAKESIADVDDALEYFESQKTEDLDLDDDDAIDYFKDDDSYTIPVEVKGKRAGWRVPMK